MKNYSKYNYDLITRCHPEKWSGKDLKGWKSCIKHRKEFVEGCQSCTIEGNTYNKLTSDPVKILSAKRQMMFAEAMKEHKKKKDKTDEKCSYCDKMIDIEEWFCYCSLCPDCYLQIPEEEIEIMDKEIEERMKYYNSPSSYFPSQSIY